MNISDEVQQKLKLMKQYDNVERNKFEKFISNGEEIKS